MPQTIANRETYVAFKLGNRSDLLQPITAPGPGGITAVSVVVGGQDYQVGDILIPQQTNAYGAELYAKTVDINGAVLTLAIIENGFNFVTATGVPTTDGNGTGCTVNITAASGVTNASRIDIWLRDAYINLIMGNRFPGQEVTIQFVTVQGVSAYSYPADIRAIQALTMYRQDGTVITVETKDMQYLRRMNNQNQAAPSMWAPFGNQINFRPVPDGPVPTGGGPYTVVLDCWQKPIILDPINTTPLLLTEDWLEVLDYMAAIRGHADLGEEEKGRAKISLLYGFTDPSGKYTPGLIQNLQTRLQAEAQFKEYGVQPMGQTQPYTRKR